jgi:hypothetical protein
MLLLIYFKPSVSFFVLKKGDFIMPSNKFQKMVYAFLTVIVTVNAFVFYSLYVVNGSTLMSVTHSTSVLGSISKQGGVYMVGSYLPIWTVLAIEFIFAFSLEMFIGSPYSFKLACKIAMPDKVNPFIFETLIICATVTIMCPIMSFIAAFLYYPYYLGFNALTLIANWLKLVCFNFPFALISQLFFIQPIIRRVFKQLFLRNHSQAKNVLTE